MSKLSIIKRSLGVYLYLTEIHGSLKNLFPFDKMDVLGERFNDDRFLYPDHWMFDEHIDFIARKQMHRMIMKGYPIGVIFKDIAKTTINERI